MKIHYYLNDHDAEAGKETVEPVAWVDGFALKNSGDEITFLHQNGNLKYFEVKFSDGDEVNAVWVCIRGTDEPTVEEAQWFMTSDSVRLKLPVAEVCEIDERTARGCYDFSNEANWLRTNRLSSMR